MAANENLTALLTAIANSIRAKTGSTEAIVANDFPSAIDNIEAGGPASYEITFTKTAVDTTKDYAMVLSRNFGVYGKDLTNSGGPLTDTAYLGDKIIIEVAGGYSVTTTGFTTGNEYTLDDPFTGTVNVYSYIVEEGTTHSITVG